MSVLLNVKSGSISSLNELTSAPAPTLDFQALLAPSSPVLQKPQPIPAHPEYIEFTRRMNPLKRQVMELRLGRVSQTSLTQLLQTIERYDWYTDPLFDQPEWTDIVMEALRRGLIDRYAASMLLLFWERSNEEGKNLRIVPLFDNEGNINPKALEIVAKSLEFAHPEVRSSKSYLTTDQIIEFFKNMKNAHNLQKYFFLSYETLKLFSGMTIQYTKLDCTPLQYFARPSHSDYGRMTPSPQMIVAFLTIHCGKENVVYPNLILGPSEWEEFLDITKHDVQIPSPDEPVPELVHNARVIKDDFTKHDLGYHLVIKSGIPKRMREIYAQISLSIKKLEDNTANTELRQHLKYWREQMLDMDLSIFRQDFRQNILRLNYLKAEDINCLFWAGFMVQLSKIRAQFNAYPDYASLKSIIMQIPRDPVLGGKLKYNSLIVDFDLFKTIAQIWKKRLKSPKRGQLGHIGSSC